MRGRVRLCVCGKGWVDCDVTPPVVLLHGLPGHEEASFTTIAAIKFDFSWVMTSSTVSSSIHLLHRHPLLTPFTSSDVISETMASSQQLVLADSRVGKHDHVLHKTGGGPGEWPLLWLWMPVTACAAGSCRRRQMARCSTQTSSSEWHHTTSAAGAQQVSAMWKNEKSPSPTRCEPGFVCCCFFFREI